MIGAELRRIGHVGEHLHHADQRADHAEGRRAIADGAIDLLAFVEMSQEIVAVAFEVVADEIHVVAVGHVAHALGQERVLDVLFFESDRPLLAGHFGETRDLVDQFARSPAAHGEDELHANRQAVHDRRQRKADQGRGGRAAENDDEGVLSRNILRSPPIMISATRTKPPNASPRPVEISMKHSNANQGATRSCPPET